MTKNLKKPQKDPWPRHQRLWRFLYAIAHRYVTRKFNITHDELDVDGPVILIPNHVTNWDPLIVGMSLRKKPCYFVATEHIFRLGFLSRVLNYVFAPIARPKGGSSLDAVRRMMDHLKKGHSICLFAEGEATWNGQSQPIFPATGKLVRMSGATLVTFRIEGGYLSLPRWGKGIRKGSVRSHVVNVYPPERLKKMTAQEINKIIETDIFENAFERQKELRTVYHGKTSAEKLESLLYYCPDCKKLGTLKSASDRVFCSCGFSTFFNEYGLFDPKAPFETIFEWDMWQKQELQKVLDKDRSEECSSPLFEDVSLTFRRVASNHETVSLGTVRMSQFPDRLELGALAFPLGEISDMAMVQECRLLFTSGGAYYEVLSEKHSGVNLRKYLDFYQISRKEAESV